MIFDNYDMLKEKGISSTDHSKIASLFIETKEYEKIHQTNLSALLQDYTEAGFIEQNEQLRKGKGTPFLNELINKSPPIPNDCIVYRYMLPFEKFPKKGRYQSYGYLSTTIDISLVKKAVCSGSTTTVQGDFVMMKIHVPKGKHALYIAHLGEAELLFPHDITLNVNYKIEEILICSTSEKEYQIGSVTVYDVDMI